MFQGDVEVFSFLKFPIQMICIELVYIGILWFQIINYSTRLYPSRTQTSRLCLFQHSLQLLLRVLLHNYCLFKISYLLGDLPTELSHLAFKMWWFLSVLFFVLNVEGAFSPNQNICMMLIIFLWTIKIKSVEEYMENVHQSS